MAEEEKLTLSVFKADVGGLIGHVSSHPDILDTAKERLYNTREKAFIADFHVLRCGDDLELIITHRKGLENPELHELVWNTFSACARVAGRLKLYNAGEDLAKSTFSGNIRESGPDVAEVEFTERESEPVVIFMANKVLPGSWNLPLYKIFADPFNTPGLVIDPAMFDGFSFRILDIAEGREVTLTTPSETPYLLALIGATQRYLISSVHRNSDGKVAAVTSARAKRRWEDEEVKTSLRRGAGTYDPIAVVRCQKGLPAVGEVLEPFSFPYLVRGWMRGSHTGPVMPVPFYEANPTRFDGPPRIISAGFQISDGRLIGPHDMFDDPSFDETRKTANKAAEYMRRHGPFQPHRLAEEELEYSAMHMVLERLKDRFKDIS